jgi:hypothetical protein
VSRQAPTHGGALASIFPAIPARSGRAEGSS